MRSAFSANIKERRDCSTALFDERGRMVVQAEHIPVHLGAMPDAVAAVCASRRLLDPQRPIHRRDAPSRRDARVAHGARLRGLRAHHADVGGMEPASLPAFSRELYQEGLVIPPMPLTDEVIDLFLANTRMPEERRGDLRAQIAAHRLAERRVEELCERRGRDRVAAGMDELLRVLGAHDACRDRAASRTDAPAEDVVEGVDGDIAIRATVEVDGDEIRIDFAGTGGAGRRTTSTARCR